jgi:DNA replication protein DnaC
MRERLALLSESLSKQESEEMQEKLRKLNEFLSKEESGEILFNSEPEVMRLLDQEKACQECKGFESCEYDGMKGRLDLWENSLRYVASKVCEVRVSYYDTQKTEKTLKKLRLPAKIARMNFTNFKADSTDLKKVLTDARKIVSGQLYKGIFLAGEPGVGKTHLGSAMLQEWTKPTKSNQSGKAGIYVIAEELFKKLRDFEKGNTSELLDLVTKVPFLFLDDLGVEKPTDFVREQLFHIINHRHNYARTAANPKGLVTVITSNYEPDELVERLNGDTKSKTGDAIMSRIVGMCIPYILGGEDRRMDG